MTAHNSMYTEKYPMKLHPQMKNYKQLITTERGQINFSHCNTEQTLKVVHVMFICLYEYVTTTTNEGSLYIEKRRDTHEKSRKEGKERNV